MRESFPWPVRRPGGQRVRGVVWTEALLDPGDSPARGHSRPRAKEIAEALRAGRPGVYTGALLMVGRSGP